MIPLLIGAGLGLVKGELDKKREAKDRQLAASTAAYSPWTGMQPQPVKRADPLGSALQGGLSGAQFGMGMDQAGQQNDLNNAMMNYYKQPQQ